jgi:hypothetical protein
VTFSRVTNESFSFGAEIIDSRHYRSDSKHIPDRLLRQWGLSWGRTSHLLRAGARSNLFEVLINFLSLFRVTSFGGKA